MAQLDESLGAMAATEDLQQGDRTALGRGPAIEARGLGRKDPKGSGWLIDGIDLELRLGDRLAIEGPSGAGKTVLLRSLALLDHLDAGALLWNGAPVRGDAVPAFRSRVIYLHQRPALPDGKVQEILERPFTLKHHGEKRFDVEFIVGLLNVLGRDASFLEKSARDLSGGESQIVALLRAIQLAPAILLLDEPTASLDAGTGRAIECLVNRWFDEQPAQRALIWITHDAEQGRRMASRVLHIEAGRLIAEP